MSTVLAHSTRARLPSPFQPGRSALRRQVLTCGRRERFNCMVWICRPTVPLTVHCLDLFFTVLGHLSRIQDALPLKELLSRKDFCTDSNLEGPEMVRARFGDAYVRLPEQRPFFLPARLAVATAAQKCTSDPQRWQERLRLFALRSAAAVPAARPFWGIWGCMARPWARSVAHLARVAAEAA